MIAKPNSTHAAIVWLYLLALLACAAETSLNIGIAPGYAGAVTTIPVLLRNATNAVAAQFDVAFNTDRVSAGPVVNGAGAANHVLKSREIAPGVRRVIVYSLEGAPLSNTVATMAFRLTEIEQGGSGPLVPGGAILANANGLPVTPLTLQPGQIFTRPVNRHEDGVVDVFLPSRPEEKYLIQATTNFVVWDNIATNFAIANFMQLVDLDGPYYPHRFYRSAVFDSVVGGLVEAVQRDSDGSVTFQITGLQGRSYTVQASLDLVNWTALGTPIVGGTRVSFKDPNISTNSHRFYRLRSD